MEIESIDFCDLSIDLIPVELRELDQWVAWRAEARDGDKPTKIPYVASNCERRASSVDPETWCCFKEAAKAASNP